MDTKKFSRWLMFAIILLAVGAFVASFLAPNIPMKEITTPRGTTTWPTQGTTTPRISPEALIIRGTAAAELKDIVPIPNSIVENPLTITGAARGTMFFEASFPIILVDGNGKTVAQGIAQAGGEWMTTDFVPFTATLTWSEAPLTEAGLLIFKRDNPSGLPEHDREAYMTLRFYSDEPSLEDEDHAD